MHFPAPSPKIKNRIIKDTRHLFENEKEDYYKPVRVGKFWSNIMVNMKVTVIEKKHYQVENILIKLNHT